MPRARTIFPRHGRRGITSPCRAAWKSRSRSAGADAVEVTATITAQFFPAITNHARSSLAPLRSRRRGRQPRASRLPARRRATARPRGARKKGRSRRTNCAARNAHAKTVGKAKAQGQDIAPLLKQGEALGGKLAALERNSPRCRRSSTSWCSACRTCCTTACRRAATKPRTSKCAAGASRASSISSRAITSIGEKLAQMDFAAAGKISGARFTVLKAGIARLQRALIQFMLDLHTGEHGYRKSTCRIS